MAAYATRLMTVSPARVDGRHRKRHQLGFSACKRQAQDKLLAGTRPPAER